MYDPGSVARIRGTERVLLFTPFLSMSGNVCANLVPRSWHSLMKP
jgi:hypothetical protein